MNTSLLIIICVSMLCGMIIGGIFVFFFTIKEIKLLELELDFFRDKFYETKRELEQCQSK